MTTVKVCIVINVTVLLRSPCLCLSLGNFGGSFSSLDSLSLEAAFPSAAELGSECRGAPEVAGGGGRSVLWQMLGLGGDMCLGLYIFFSLFIVLCLDVAILFAWWCWFHSRVLKDFGCLFR